MMLTERCECVPQSCYDRSDSLLSQTDLPPVFCRVFKTKRHIFTADSGDYYDIKDGASQSA